MSHYLSLLSHIRQFRYPFKIGISCCITTILNELWHLRDGLRIHRRSLDNGRLKQKVIDLLLSNQLVYLVPTSEGLHSDVLQIYYVIIVLLSVSLLSRGELLVNASSAFDLAVVGERTAEASRGAGVEVSAFEDRCLVLLAPEALVTIASVALMMTAVATLLHIVLLFCLQGLHMRGGARAVVFHAHSLFFLKLLILMSCQLMMMIRLFTHGFSSLSHRVLEEDPWSQIPAKFDPVLSWLLLIQGERGIREQVIDYHWQLRELSRIVLIHVQLVQHFDFQGKVGHS